MWLFIYKFAQLYTLGGQYIAMTMECRGRFEEWP